MTPCRILQCEVIYLLVRPWEIRCQHRCRAIKIEVYMRWIWLVAGYLLVPAGAHHFVHGSVVAALWVKCCHSRDLIPCLPSFPSVQELSTTGLVNSPLSQTSIPMCSGFCCGKGFIGQHLEPSGQCLTRSWSYNVSIFYSFNGSPPG